MRTNRFVARSRFDLPVEDLWRWHMLPGAFERLNPPWERVVVRRRDGPIGEGVRVELSLRAGPGTNNARLNVAAEGSIILILDGPRADENGQTYVWWFIRDETNNEGWVVQDFLVPSLPPGTE